MMKKIICLLAVLLLSTLHTVKVDAEFISHKNMVHIEKISSACALSLLLAAFSQRNGWMLVTALVTTVGCQLTNIMANMALGVGYTKDKKAFLRMSPQAIALGSLATLIVLDEDCDMVKKCCQKLILASLLGMTIKEATDIYSLVSA